MRNKYFKGVYLTTKIHKEMPRWTFKVSGYHFPTVAHRYLVFRKTRHSVSCMKGQNMCQRLKSVHF